MAERKQPRLVKLDKKPERTRRSVYSDIVEQFAADPSMKYAKVEGAPATALPSLKKAIAKLGAKNVVAYTANGELILEKK
jgi:nitrogenase molybdenum-iron protein alpha/beta subunit